MSGAIRVFKRDDGLWGINADYSPALIEHAKAVPGITFDYPNKTWVGHADAIAACVARLGTKGIHVFGAKELPDPESWRTARTPFLFSTQNLREYQVEGVRFLIMRSKEGALLADGMRLGKSCQATVAARAFKQKTLVCCPPHIIGVWARPKTAPEGPGEIAKWWPDAWKASDESDAPGVMVLEGVKPAKAQALVRKLAKKLTNGEDLTAAEENAHRAALAELHARAKAIQYANVIVCHYDILYAWVDVLKQWGIATFILDEGHLIAGYQSRRSDALKELRHFATRCMMLTGTPVTNIPRTLHNMLEILAPGRFGFFWTEKRPGCYGRLFCDPKMKQFGSGENMKTVNDFTGRSNLDEPDGIHALTKEETLKQRLRYVMLRRLKKDVDPQLPQKQRQIIDVAIPAKQMIRLNEGILRGKGEDLRLALDHAADGKLKDVVSLVAGHVAEDEKVLCFCYRRLFAEAVADHLTEKVAAEAKIVFVHGGLTQKERDRRIHALRTHKGPGVLACTIDTTSTGIDLSFSNVAVVAELVWEPHELAQLEERLYAYGKDVKALVQYVIARGTGDELVLRGVIQKLDTFERVVGETGDRMREDLSKQKEDPMKRLAAALAEMQKSLVPTTKTRKRPTMGA